jgi:hypothetical protein
MSGCVPQVGVAVILIRKLSVKSCPIVASYVHVITPVEELIERPTGSPVAEYTIVRHFGSTTPPTLIDGSGENPQLSSTAILDSTGPVGTGSTTTSAFVLKFFS